MNEVTPMAQIIAKIQAQTAAQSQTQSVYRFDIFKGFSNSDGKIIKTKSVGAAYIKDGFKTYTVSLKTFLNDKFYLLPNTKPADSGSSFDFVILTRETAHHIKRKYFWNSVGQGLILDGPNRGVVKLSWDVLSDDLYMNLHPANISELPEASRADEVA